MATVQQVNPDVDIDLRALLAGMRRDWLRHLAIAVAVAVLAVGIASLAAPKYYAESRILIETRESAFTRPENATFDENLDVEGVASQVELIASSDLLKQVADELDLASRPAFNASSSLAGRLLVLLGLRRDPAMIPPQERVLRAMRDRLDIYQVRNSRVIVIGFSATDPALAAGVPQAITAAYAEMQRGAGLQSTGAATEWLEQEINDLRGRVQEAERQVAEFQASAGLLPGRDNAPLATQQLTELASELSRVRAARASAEASASSLRQALSRGLAAASLPEGVSSPLIERLRERQADLQAELADFSTTLLDNHPRMRSTRSQLRALDGQIAAEAQNILARLDAEVEAARARETELMAALNVAQAEAARAGEQQVELRALEREAAAQRELLESYLTRHREASARRDRNYLPANVRVFSEASVPSVPYFPKYTPIALAAFAATLLILLVATLLRELYSGRALREPNPSSPVGPAEMPVEVSPPSPSLQHAAPSRAARAMPDSIPPAQPADSEPTVVRPMAQPSRSGLVHDIAFAARYLRASGRPVALLVSPEGDAAATVSVRIAREIADAGRRVLLLDLSVSGAASGPMLEDLRPDGITDLLAGEAQFTDIIHSDAYSDCDVIPTGNADPERAMRNADRLPIILQSLTAAYDLVLVECGAAEPEAIGKLAQDEADIFIATTGDDAEAANVLAAQLQRAGYRRPMQIAAR